MGTAPELGDLFPNDRVAMTLSEQTHSFLLPIYDDGKKVCHVPSEHADVEGIFVGDTQVSTAQENFSIVVVRLENLRLDRHCGRQATNTADAMIGFQGGQAESC